MPRFRLHPQHRIAAYARRGSEDYDMPGTVEEVLAAIFAGEGELVAQTDSAAGQYPGYVCCALRGYQVELRGSLEAGRWSLTAEVSVQPIDSEG